MPESSSPSQQTMDLRDALRSISADMHNTSTRGCKTCSEITKALGEPFGCYAYQARRAAQAATKTREQR